MEHKDKDKQENLEFPDQKIVGIEMRHEVENSFIAYSMSVIMSRALPDVRDGLKPVHRRILYAMYEDHLTYDKASETCSDAIIRTVTQRFTIRWCVSLSPSR